MNKPGRAAFAALATALLIGSLTACSAASGDSHDYPDQVRDNFITSCEDSAGDQSAMCAPCFEEIEKAFTLDEFTKLDAALADGTASAEDQKKLTDIMMSCAAQ